MAFKNKLIRFMASRYGIDEFYSFLMVLNLLFVIFNIFISKLWVSLIILLLVIYTTYRAFSKNITKRREENLKYLRIKNKLKCFFNKPSKSEKLKDKKTHVFRICPSCKAKLRLPRKKGPHHVRCTRCQTLFEVQIR